MNKVAKDVLEELYVNQGKPMHEIAKELGIAVGSVYNYMKEYGIKSRTHKECFDELKENGWRYPQSARERISKAHKGKKVSSETRRKMSDAFKEGGVGHKKTRSDGYVAIYFPDHPKTSKDGYIMGHILVMEALLGRHLKDDEVVHHINGTRDDNRKENLKLMTFKEHAKYHMEQRWKNKKERWNDLSIR